jgi:dienelactone hydrolase
MPEFTMPHTSRPLIALLAISLLSACGGGDDDAAVIAPTPPPQRGALLESPPPRLAQYSTNELLAMLADSAFSEEVLQLVLTPKCAVDVHQLKYQTVDPAGTLTPASGALMIPNGSDPACQGARPIVLYAHGTSTDRAFNIADLSNADNGEGLLIAAVFAAEGYIVVAPNYVGYDTSTLGYHPYLHGDQQAKDMIDALAAARSALPTSFAPGTTDGGKLFVTGYSQGGYVAMATHRAMQIAGLTVTASAPMSGPYALAAFGDALFEGQVSANSPVNLTLLISGYQHAYGNIYASATDAFEAAYASGIDTLLPSATPLSDLRAQGKLPQDALFNSTPPDPAFASMTPATLPANLAPVFAKGFGTDNLLTNSFRLAYLQDAQAHPDGGFPAVTDGLPPADPANPLRQALKINDQRNWTPTAPMLVCAGNSDPTVFYLNTQLMQDYWAAAAPAAPVTVLDVDSAAGSGDPYATLKAQFTAAKDLVRVDAVLGGASDGGDAAVLDAYHAGLVPPFCLIAVKSFLDAH